MTYKAMAIRASLGVAVLFVLLGMRMVLAGTLDLLTVTEETDSYVMVSAGGKTVRVYKQFQDDFEGVPLQEWFGDTRWTGMELLSPMRQNASHLSVANLASEIEFLDNRIEVERNLVVLGDTAARFTAVEPAKGIVTSKSSILYSGLWFVNGDDLWFRAMFYLEEGVPYSLADFEDNNMRISPGPRIVINGGKYLGLEMKHLFKPRLSQFEVEVPIGQWFEIKLHLVLDNDQGLVQMWQDDVVVLEGQLKTLPAAKSLLNSLEVGITATDMATSLLVDDVEISHTPP